jgi:diguanylate cyclase (GGDEF)-like protein
MSYCELSIEDQRLAALYEYDILDTPPEESFDRITRLVKVTMRTPIAVVSLVDRDRQWFKSRQGTEMMETKRDISFCTQTIQRNEPLVIPNALEDPRFCNSPLVACEGGVRLYVGVPLRTPSGFNIGALCAIDTKPGEVTQDQLNVMQDLARLVVDELELRKLAAVDSLTGARTARSFALDTKKAFSMARKHKRNLGCIVFDLDHFKQINDTYGHAAGDQVLRTIADRCSEILRPVDIFGRVGGEEFAITLPETSLGGAFQLAERLRAEIAGTEVPFSGIDLNVTASFGVTVFSVFDRDFETARNRADVALYQAKARGRNRAVCAAANPAADISEVA